MNLPKFGFYISLLIDIKVLLQRTTEAKAFDTDDKLSCYSDKATFFFISELNIIKFSYNMGSLLLDGLILESNPYYK